MTIKRHEAQFLPCPVCGQSCRAEVALKHKEAASLPQSPRDVLRLFCKAGGELGCSCADGNYQWFDRECKERMAGAFKHMLADTRPDGNSK
jgi:hypothetical protein